MDNHQIPAADLTADRLALAKSLVVLDIGGTHVRCAAARSGAALEEVQQLSTQIFSNGDPVKVLERIIRGFAADQGLHDFDVVVGLPATLDRDMDVVLKINNIPSLEGLKLRSMLRERFSERVVLEHDIVLQLMGEWFAGTARSSRSVLGVYSGTGVGGAFLLDGAPIRSKSTGIEIGHIPVRNEGRRCVCGRRDCLEAYASGRHLLDWSEKYAVPIERLFIEAKNLPSLAYEVKGFLEDQATAVSTAITLIDPELVVLGGGVIQMAGYPIDDLIEMIRQRLQDPELALSVRFARSMLGHSAAVYGGMCLLSKSK